MAVGCLVLEYPGLERPQATRWAGQSWALISTSGFSFFWAEDWAEVRAVQCRRVVCSIERLRERQEAAGNELKNQSERGGCLLFARRNGSMPLLDSCSVISPRYLAFASWPGCLAMIVCISVGIE
jgi:hypothetical protein